MKYNQNSYAKYFVPLLFILLLFAVIFFAFNSKTPQTNYVPAKSNHKLSIEDRVSISVELADTPGKRALGLSYRKSLPEGHGMLFIFPEPFIPVFWMKGMNFPLDMIWVGENNTIVEITEHVPHPSKDVMEYDLPRYSPKTLTKNVLEVNAGFSKKYNLRVGDRVVLQ